MSFTPARRFTADMARSPAWAVRDRVAERSAAGSISSRPVRTAARRPTATAAPTPPRAPAHVFPGLICGARGRPPIARPTKYAPVSVATTTAQTQAATNSPSSGYWRSMTSAAGARPAAIMPATLQKAPQARGERRMHPTAAPAAATARAGAGPPSAAARGAPAQPSANPQSRGLPSGAVRARHSRPAKSANRAATAASQYVPSTRHSTQGIPIRSAVVTRTQSLRFALMRPRRRQSGARAAQNHPVRV